MTVGGQNCYLHRLVLETLLGRRLRTKEHVHHVDGNKRNNHPSNLQLLSASAHSALARRHPLVCFCPWCGEPFLWRRSGHGPARTCSRQCGHRWSWGPMGRRRLAFLARQAR